MTGSEDRESYRTILFSTSIIGGATVITILVAIFRTKVLALLSGPEGIGLLGVLTNISGLVTVIAGLGLTVAAVRELAAAPGPTRQAEISRALLLGSLPLALIASLGLWFLREPVARLATDSGEHALLIGLSGLAVLLGVVASTQQAVLQGLQRVRALAWVRIGGAIGATLLAIPAVWLLGLAGIVVAVIAIPLATLVAALAFRPRELPAPGPLDLDGLRRDVRAMAGLGAVMTVTGAVQLLCLAFVRTLVVQEGDLAAAGLFQAVVAVTSMNITLVLGAMASDYFPRLSAAAGDSTQLKRIVNDQLHVALLLGSPLLLALVAAAPLVLTLLYTTEFAAAEEMLRWQLIGDLLKIPGWALGFVLLAKGDHRAFLAVELLFSLTYAGMALLLVPRFGLEGAGMAHLLAYLFYSLLLVAICRSRHGVRIGQGNALLAALALVGLVTLTLLGNRSELLALGAGALLALAFGLFAARELASRAGLRLGKSA